MSKIHTEAQVREMLREKLSARTILAELKGETDE